MLALEGRAVDVTKAPTPLCKGLTQLAQAWRKRNGAEFVKLARETYPLVRDYDVKKTPFGMAALSYLLQTGEGMAVGDFQAEVVLDQAGSSRFNAVLAAILRGRAGWNGWSDIPQNDQADAMKLNAAFEKALLAQLGQGRFSPELFNLYRSTRRGNRWLRRKRS
jgi:hypothetical protein